MASVIGLDVGTHAVRAAELNLGRGGPVLNRFAQVALPLGAVQNGEVVDPAAVAAALSRLWREGGFRRREVIVGVANQRVIVRQAEVPMMSEDDLRSSLQYQVQELIPIPVAEARMDFQILGEVAGPGEEPRLRILLVAAHGEMLDNLLAALDGANLQPRLVDAGPFALVRALDDPLADLDAGPGESDAFISVGAGITTVVVVEGGVPQFVRILVAGGADLTAAIASELDVDPETAEDLKRRADPESDDELLVQAAALMEAHVAPLVEEVRGSLDFHLAQSPLSTIRRIQVTGGGARVDEFIERLGEVMGVPTERADPLRTITVGRTGLTDAQLDAGRDVMTTAIGLALAGLPPPEGTRRISLLPSEIMVARVARRQVALAAAAVGGLAALLLLLWVIRGAQVSDERDQAAEEEARAARLRAEIGQLADVEELEQLIGERRQLAAAALENDVSWPRLLQEVATVIPTDVWLTTFNGSSVSGDVNFAGQGFDHTSSARWLLRVSDLPSLTALWLPSSVRSEGGEAGRSLVTFSSTGLLTPAAQSDRLAELEDSG